MRSRELIGLVGIECFGVKVTELADAPGKSRDGVSNWMRRGTLRRETDPDFAGAVDALDHAASEGNYSQVCKAVPGTFTDLSLVKSTGVGDRPLGMAFDGANMSITLNNVGYVAKR